MPIYEYRCPDCDVTFSKMRSMSQADEPVECEDCHGKKATRLLSRIAAYRRGGNGTGGGSSCAGCSSSNCSSCRH